MKHIEINSIFGPYLKAHAEISAHSASICKALNDPAIPIKSLAQARILDALHRFGELDITELSEVSNTLMPSISRMLPSMEFEQIVVAQVCDGDKRRLKVKITNRGAKALRKLLSVKVAVDE